MLTSETRNSQKNKKELDAVRKCLIVLLAFAAFGCSMSEEMRRIEETREAQLRREQSKSTNLSGEQVFVRSCNTCHPQGKAGMGPSLEHISEHFPDQESLKTLIRNGKGLMPGQPKTVINEPEMDNLLEYLKTFSTPN